jgi:hypothetical protein
MACTAYRQPCGVLLLHRPAAWNVVDADQDPLGEFTDTAALGEAGTNRMKFYVRRTSSRDHVYLGQTNVVYEAQHVPVEIRRRSQIIVEYTARH